MHIAQKLLYISKFIDKKLPFLVQETAVLLFVAFKLD